MEIEKNQITFNQKYILLKEQLSNWNNDFEKVKDL